MRPETRAAQVSLSRCLTSRHPSLTSPHVLDTEEFGRVRIHRYFDLSARRDVECPTGVKRAQPDGFLGTDPRRSPVAEVQQRDERRFAARTDKTADPQAQRGVFKDDAENAPDAKPRAGFLQSVDLRGVQRQHHVLPFQRISNSGFPSSHRIRF